MSQNICGIWPTQLPTVSNTEMSSS